MIRVSHDANIREGFLDAKEVCGATAVGHRWIAQRSRMIRVSHDANIREGFLDAKEVCGATARASYPHDATCLKFVPSNNFGSHA
ncbi:hypothetical protein ABBQ38_012025 [Trebouxia sp. C0009 RCD-2024]